jgi:hypothetical protein
VSTGSIYEHRLRRLRDDHMLYVVRWECSELVGAIRYQSHISNAHDLREHFISFQTSRISENCLQFLPPLTPMTAAAQMGTSVITQYNDFGTSLAERDDVISEHDDNEDERAGPEMTEDDIAGEAILEMMSNESEADENEIIAMTTSQEPNQHDRRNNEINHVRSLISSLTADQAAPVKPSSGRILCTQQSSSMDEEELSVGPDRIVFINQLEVRNMLSGST